MELSRWKVIAGGAALAGIAAGGVIGANADDGIDLNDRRPAISLADDAADSPAVADDGSPESADSPNESVDESADSPFDSPDDPAAVYLSGLSTDSPAPAPRPAPAPAPVQSADSPASAPSPASADSPDSDD